VRILGDSRDGGHAKVHQNLGHVPHQDRQPPGLGDAVRLSFLKEPPEFDQLHQLLMIVPGVMSLGLCLHQHCLVQRQVPLPPVEHHVEAEGALGMSSVSHHLIEVLLPSSLVPNPLAVKVGTNLGEGFL
jgi:hypothetical protein